MSIDARVKAVIRILPGHCETCGDTGQSPETNWDDCPVCYGTSTGKQALRLHLEPREPSGAAGQPVLTVVNPPEGDMSGLVGTELWGNATQIMVGEKSWARRIGYTRIELLDA